MDHGNRTVNPQLELFHYWRSSSSWRVRAALDYKAVSYQATAVNLLNGETEKPEYLIRNPAGTVPTLKFLAEDGKEVCLVESLAIIVYLDQTYPTRPLVSGSAIDRARIWALAELVNSGTHPIQNLPVLQYYSSDPAEQKKWAAHWIASGLENFETLCNSYGTATQFCYGDSLTLADLCLIPQVYNALRYEVDMTAFPTIKRIYDHCLTLSCFDSSHPDRFKPS